MENKMIPRAEFPRPDFVRKEWELLNGEWEFSFDEPSFDKIILVPFCYQAKMSGIGLVEEHDIVWYRRSFNVDNENYNKKRVLLKFGAVDSYAEIWINGLFVGNHTGGNTSFTLDITEVIKKGTNELVVKAVDYANADKPRGKQTWKGERFGCWYTPTTGIWQSVWLEYVGENYLKRTKITPDVGDLSALCELFVSCNDEIDVEVISSMKDGKVVLGRQIVTCKHGYGKAVLAIPDYDLRRNELLWSPENPNLIDVSLRVLGKEGFIDEVGTYFGMRSIESLNGCLSLNGNIYYQRLILDQGYWPESLLTPPSDEAIQQDILLTKEMGFNGARKHQKIEDPRYYYWADKLGLLVWGELPSAYEFNDNAIINSSKELVEFVERDYNHPCIVTWVPVNESWGVRNIQINKQQQDYCRMLTYLLKAMDPVRIVSSNDGWEQIEDTDICAIHDYALFPNTTGKYDDIDHILKTLAESRYIYANGNEYKGQPILMTEYGGIAFEGENKDNWGYYNNVKNEEEFIKRLAPITEFLIKSGTFSGYCYTQLTDVMQEVNGLLTEDRKPKISVERLKEIFSQRVY